MKVYSGSNMCWYMCLWCFVSQLWSDKGSEDRKLSAICFHWVRNSTLRFLLSVFAAHFLLVVYDHSGIVCCSFSYNLEQFWQTQKYEGLVGSLAVLAVWWVKWNCVTCDHLLHDLCYVILMMESFPGMPLVICDGVSWSLGDFTFWLRLSLCLNFSLSTYLSQKMKWFCLAKTWRLTRIV